MTESFRDMNEVIQTCVKRLQHTNLVPNRQRYFKYNFKDKNNFKDNFIRF